GPLDVVTVQRIGLHVAQGLAVAHAKGLVHCDIKPANILLDGDAGRAKITDFGLARALDDAGLERSGVRAGTPFFMSPEQARGEPVDHRSDLYSLGATLFAALTGRPPSQSESVGSIRATCGKDEPLSPGRLNRDAKDEFEAIISRLLAKAPAERYSTATE